MNSRARVALAQETLAIIERGFYLSPTGRQVTIAEAAQTAVAGTKSYQPNAFPSELTLPPTAPRYQTAFEVTDETTLVAARRLSAEDSTADLLCLNFASAKNPGGGFLRGTQAQEESLARSSALYPCLLRHSAMYDYNRRANTCLYSDYMIFSPSVPMFRADDGTLLEESYNVSVLTSPAVNAGALRRNEPHNVAAIQPTMAQRLQKLLWVAQQNGQKRLILGAWGCGVFDNDAAMVAALFHAALEPQSLFGQAFERVVFAVYDSSAGQTSLNAFKSEFPAPTL